MVLCASVRYELIWWDAMAMGLILIFIHYRK
jgi:hypothetical protein